jgi:hypothetical protein
MATRQTAAITQVAPHVKKPTRKHPAAIAPQTSYGPGLCLFLYKQFTHPHDWHGPTSLDVFTKDPKKSDLKENGFLGCGWIGGAATVFAAHVAHFPFVRSLYALDICFLQSMQ